MISIIQAAGWPIWPLILCSVVAVALIIERFLSLRVRLIHPPTLVEEVIAVSRNGVPPADVVSKLATSSALGGVLAAGFEAVAAEPKLPEAALRQQLENAGREALHRMDRYLNTLGTIATAVGEEAGTIEDVYEPFLIQQGFLQRTLRGREVTRRAYEHLGRSFTDKNENLLF